MGDKRETLCNTLSGNLKIIWTDRRAFFGKFCADPAEYCRVIAVKRQNRVGGKKQIHDAFGSFAPFAFITAIFQFTDGYGRYKDFRR